MTTIKTVLRLGATLGGLSFSQIVTRARHLVRRRCWRLTGAEFRPTPTGTLRQFSCVWCDIPEVIVDAPARLQQELADLKGEASEVAEGRFRFLGVQVNFRGVINWNDPAHSQLWRYHLHYFGCARALTVSWRHSGDEMHWLVFRRLVREWLNGNRRLQGDGWHPYTLSLRIVNWLQAAAVWRELMDADQKFLAEFQAALYGQVRLLRRQLEFDVRGNHLLENLRALIWSGVAFDGPEASEWLRDGLTILERETEEQILPDGGHFERTPGYHATVLHVLLEIALLLERNARPSYGWLRAAIERQARFLKQMLGPDGRLPLIKDTAFDAVPDPDDLLHVAAQFLRADALRPSREPGLLAYLLLGTEKMAALNNQLRLRELGGAWRAKDSGFGFARAGGEFLVVDLGKPCPDYLPAHAHADTFSFEYHHFGVPVVVDSGVFEYRRGRWRDYFRSTRAHSTVEVGGENSSDVWSSFRVGRRARPAVKAWRSTLNSMLLHAVHDGYRNLPGRPVHERVVRWEAGEFLVVVDRVSSAARHPVRSFLHLHPDWTPVACGRDWRLYSPAGTLFIRSIGEAEIGCLEPSEGDRPQGWYSERFGERRAKPVLTWKWTSGDHGFLGYIITPHESLSHQSGTSPYHSQVLQLARLAVRWTVDLPPQDNTRVE